jgi:hypothetical protein
MSCKRTKKQFFYLFPKINFLAHAHHVLTQNFRRTNFKKTKAFEFFFQSRSPLHIEALWYKNHVNLRDRKSHTWTPLREKKEISVSKFAFK